MSRRKIACFFLFLVIINSLFSEQISLASWNIRILSDNSRSDEELSMIASIARNYDFIALQEVRDEQVLRRLCAFLPAYSYIVSDPVGNRVTERYAYLYRTDIFRVLGTAHIYADVDDNFIREPYIAHFRAGNFDFTVVSIHVLYGSVSQRLAEIRLLDELLADIDQYNGSENDVILLGDFNRSADDESFQIQTHEPLIPPSVYTTIYDSSSYDNIWINPVETTECTGEYSVSRFDETMFGNDDSTASLHVSDHRPVSTCFITSNEDDDGSGAWVNVGGSGVLSRTSRTGTVIFHEIIYTPTDAEEIVIMNHSDWAVDISDWIIGDKNNPRAYSIPGNTVIEPEQTLSFPHTTLGFGINDTGEELYLINSDGQTVDFWEN
ncbi:MAG: lamin tail domain-containing protein [Spirochaetia bacterium]